MTNEDVKRLRNRYAEFGCPGFVALIDYLGLPENSGLKEIGSSSVNIPNFKLGGLYIGSGDGTLMPLEWLDKFSERFMDIPEINRKALDEFCAALVEMGGSKPTGEVEIWHAGAVYVVPAENYRRGMTQNELEPYRAQESKLFPGSKSTTH